MIDTAAHIENLQALAAEATATPVSFMLVEDCAKWAATAGIMLAGNPNALAIRRPSDEQLIVVLRQSYGADHIARASSSLWAAGWPDQAEEVKVPLACVKFLVLHELAHLINNWGQEHEQDCNEWAFKRLGWVPD